MNSQLIRIVGHALTVTCLLIWLVSCSVKEDRSVCPCNLEIVFDDKEHITGPLMMAGWSEGELFDLIVNTEDYPDGYIKQTPRTMIAFGAAEGVVRCTRTGHCLVIPEGFECDSLYVCSDYIDCTGESAQTVVKLHKQFAVLHLGVTSEDFDADDYSISVNSKSRGIDMLTCEAIAGNFSCTPRPCDNNKYQCCISRQGDDSMTLTVVHHTGLTVDFPLGSYISSIGYDWREQDLKDIYITLDIARGRVGVGVAGWESVENFELSKVEL